MPWDGASQGLTRRGARLGLVRRWSGSDPVPRSDCRPSGAGHSATLGAQSCGVAYRGQKTGRTTTVTITRMIVRGVPTRRKSR